MTARLFLHARSVTGEPADRVWTAIALHATPEIPLHMAPEFALVTRGVELDVLGIGYHAVRDEQRAAVLAAHPRPDFKNQILDAFTEGIRHRPETTFGNVKADVLEHFIPGFVRGDFRRGHRELRLARVKPAPNAPLTGPGFRTNLHAIQVGE